MEDCTYLRLESMCEKEFFTDPLRCNTSHHVENGVNRFALSLGKSLLAIPPLLHGVRWALYSGDVILYVE
jgi:hypothetical protein